MRLGEEQIEKLQKLLKSELGLEYTFEQAQTTGMAIVRFIQVKKARTEELKTKRKENESGHAQ